MLQSDWGNGPNITHVGNLFLAAASHYPLQVKVSKRSFG